MKCLFIFCFLYFCKRKSWIGLHYWYFILSLPLTIIWYMHIELSFWFVFDFNFLSYCCRSQHGLCGKQFCNWQCYHVKIKPQINIKKYEWNTILVIQNAMLQIVWGYDTNNLIIHYCMIIHCIIHLGVIFCSHFGFCSICMN